MKNKTKHLVGVTINGEFVNISEDYLRVILTSGFAEIKLDTCFNRWAEELAQELRRE